MKRWNSIWLLLIVLLLSCDGIKIWDIQSDFILAGVESDKLDMQLFSSELKISFENEAAGDFHTEVFSGDLLIDLDSDNSNDIKFHAYYGYSCPMAGCFSPTKACEVKNVENKEIEICHTPLKLNDTIDNNLDWKILGPKIDGEQIIFSTILSSYTPKWTYTEEKANNVWIKDNLYLAFRIKKGDIYKFGWVKLFIGDYYDLKIRKIGFEK